MNHCKPGAKTPSISVTLKDYKTGCQCIPAPPPIPPSCPPTDNNGIAADKLTSVRKISLSGAASGSGYFDGSADMDIAVSIPTISNVELDNLMDGDAVVNGGAFLDANGLLFLLDRIKALVEAEAGDSINPGELTDEQINDLFSSVEIIHGGDANGTD